MTEKRFTYDSKTVSILKDGEFWLDGNVDTACNHSEICQELNELAEENQRLHDEVFRLRTELAYDRTVNDGKDWFKAEDEHLKWESYLND